MSDQKCQEEYVRRIHKVQDYIETHIDTNLSVEELAQTAGFSKYHFSRIFQAMLQEPLAHYVNRIRMERALFLLAHRTDKNMTEIAFDLGFSDSAVFSRTFKNHFGMSPKEYRKDYSKNCKESILLSSYNKGAVKKNWENNRLLVTGDITLENRVEEQVAYVRHTGTYETLAKEYPRLIQTLFNQAMAQHLLVRNKNCVLAMYHDNPEFGTETQFRTSLCLTVPDDLTIQEDGILGKMTLEGGLYAVGHFQIQQDQYGDAWDYMYQEWISGSGYVPRDYSPFEVYRSVPRDEDDVIHHVDIYLPIEPILF